MVKQSRVLAMRFGLTTPPDSRLSRRLAAKSTKKARTRLGLLKENALNKVVKRPQPDAGRKALQQLTLRQVIANVLNKKMIAFLEDQAIMNLIAEDQEMLEEQHNAFLDFFDGLDKKKDMRLQRCDSLGGLRASYTGFCSSRESSRALACIL